MLVKIGHRECGALQTRGMADSARFPFDAPLPAASFEVPTAGEGAAPGAAAVEDHGRSAANAGPTGEGVGDALSATATVAPRADRDVDGRDGAPVVGSVVAGPAHPAGESDADGAGADDAFGDDALGDYGRAATSAVGEPRDARSPGPAGSATPAASGSGDGDRSPAATASRHRGARRLPVAADERDRAPAKTRRAARLSQPMLHRRPDPACPLCPVAGVLYEAHRRRTHGLQHVDAELLWRAYTPGRSLAGGVRASRVVAAAAELGVDVTAEQVVVHYRDHGVEQPAFTGGDRQSLLIHAQLALTDRERHLLIGLYRRRVMTMAQIVEVFYHDLSPAYAERHARRNLAYLMHQGFVYRYFVDASDRPVITPKGTAKPEHVKHISKQTRGEQMRAGLGAQAANTPFFFLGKAAVPFVETVTGATLWEGDHYFQSSTQIGQSSLPHDVRANDVYVSLVRALRASGGTVRVGDTDQPAAVLDVRGLPSNWHGPRSLSLWYYDKTQLDYDEMRPDGLAAIDLPHAPGGPPATQLPFFIEFDRGGRKLPEVRKQLLAYHRMAISGAAGRRFPQLAVEGYAVPVLMVFSDRKRMEHVLRHLAADAAAARLVPEGRRGAPILFAVEDEWNADPFAADCYDAWDPAAGAGDFLRLLGRHSRRLIEASAERHLVPGRPLRIDLAGAKPKAQGAYGDRKVTSARERDAEAKAKAKRIAAQNEALREKFGVELS